MGKSFPQGVSNNVENFLKIAINSKMLLTDLVKNEWKNGLESLLVSDKTPNFNIACGKPMWKTPQSCGKVGVGCEFSVDYPFAPFFIHICNSQGFPQAAPAVSGSFKDRLTDKRAAVIMKN